MSHHFFQDKKSVIRVVKKIVRSKWKFRPLLFSLDFAFRIGRLPVVAREYLERHSRES